MRSDGDSGLWPSLPFVMRTHFCRNAVRYIMAAPRWPFSRAAPGIGLYTTPLKSIRSSFSSRAFSVVLPCPPDSGPLQRFPVPTAFPVVVQIPGFSANPAASTSLGVPVVLQCPWILGLYNGFHFPQGFPWFSVSLDSGPLHRFRLSRAFPVVWQSPRNLGLYTSFRFPGRFPWFCRVPGIWASAVVCVLSHSRRHDV